ncbi:MAG: hypothetical protein RXQ77_00855 [Candidatus Nanopusillus sp.]
MRGISLWIEFLIYTAFALSILSLVIYFVHLTIQNQQDELNLKYIVNLLTNLNYQIETIGSCYSCNYKAYENLPSKTIIYIYPGEIICVYYSTVNYSLQVPTYINLNITELSPYNYEYNFTINTIPFNLLNSSNQPIVSNLCLLLNKNQSGLYASLC